MANDLIPYDNNSESEVITLPEREEKYSIIPTVVSNAFNKYFWDKRNAEDANIIDDTIIMPQPERIGIDAPPAKERGRTIDSASGDPINMPPPERQVATSPKREVTTLPKQEVTTFQKQFESDTFNRDFWWGDQPTEVANIIDDTIIMPQTQPERIGIDAPPPAKERASGDPLNLPQPERQGLPEPIPPEVKLFQEKMEAKQKQTSPIVEKKKGGEVGKTLLKTLGKGASFLLPYLVKAAAAGIDNLAALPKTALEGSMSPEQKALYGGGLAGAFANVSAAAPLPVTDRMREIADALLLHRMQQKYIDMLKKQAEYMKTLDLNGHQLDYLGRQASGIAFMNNKAPGAINGIKR